MKDILNFRAALANLYKFFYDYKTDKKLDQYIQEVAKLCAYLPVELPPEFYKSLIYHIADEFPDMDSREIINMAMTNENVVNRIMLALLETLKKEDKKDEKH